MTAWSAAREPVTGHHLGIPQPAGLHPHEIDRLGRRRPLDEDHLLGREQHGGRLVDTGLTPHLVRGRLGEGCERGQTPLRGRRHDPGRGADSVDRGGHFGVEAVGQPAHAERESEDEPDTDDGDEELPGSEPQVRKRDRQHASTHSRHLGDAAHYRCSP